MTEPNSELLIKTERLQSLMDREGLAGVILTAQRNFSWITCGASNAIDESQEYGAASVLVTREGKLFLFANNIESSRFADEVVGDEFSVIDFPWLDETSHPGLLVDSARSAAGGDVATDLSMFGGAPAIDHLIAPLRMQLTAEEIGRFEALGIDAGHALRRVFDHVSPGESEVKIAARMRFELASAGIDPIVTLVAADERIEKFRHPVPTQKAWTRDLMLVTCARRHGLVASLTRIAALGEASPELHARTNAAAKIYAAMLDATRPGATGAEVFARTAGAYRDVGFDGEIARHHQGGAAGYRTRDWIAHPSSREIVLADQAFAWNPSITGTKVEDTVVVDGSGNIKTLTQSPDFPIIQTEIDGNVYEATGVWEVHR